MDKEDVVCGMRYEDGEMGLRAFGRVVWFSFVGEKERSVSPGSVEVLAAVKCVLEK